MSLDTFKTAKKTIGVKQVTKAVEKDSMKFCSKLLEEKGVAVVPGLGFGADGYFRLSFATDDATIKDGIGRIKAFVENYK